EAFENAALGMFSLMGELDNVREIEEFSVTVDAEDRETLLVEWLNELICIFESNRVLLKNFRVTDLGETHLTATATGEPFDRDRHRLKTEIKAATFHMLKVKESSQGWETHVIFDV
ncbi:MAG: archease, partial [Thermoleophilia bacterium]